MATKDVIMPMGHSNTRIYGHRTRILKRLPQELALLLGENDLRGDAKDMFAHPLDYLERMIKSVESLRDGHKRNVPPKLHMAVGKQNGLYELQPPGNRLSAIEGSVVNEFMNPPIDMMENHASRLRHSGEAEEEYDYVVARNEDAAHRGYALRLEIGADEYEDIDHFEPERQKAALRLLGYEAQGASLFLLRGAEGTYTQKRKQPPMLSRK